MGTATITEARKALAAQLQANISGVTALPYMPDQVNPPVMAVLPGQPAVQYGLTLGEAMAAQGMQGIMGGEYNLVILVITTLASSIEEAQETLDSLIGFNGNTSCVQGAIAEDSTLGGVVDFCVPMAVATYGQIDVAGQTYFGARITVKVGV